MKINRMGKPEERVREENMKMQRSLWGIRTWLFAMMITMGMVFGMSAAQAANTVSGTIYNDSTGLLGVPNLPYGDYPVSDGFVVALYNGATEVATGTTAPDGSYTIQAPGPGSYTVKVKSSPTTDYQIVAADSQPAMLTGNDLTARDLFVRGTAGNLSGVVSTQDSSTTLVGIKIYLTGTTTGGKSVSAYATTATGGSYTFSNLPPGNYTLTPDLQDIEDQSFAYLNAAGIVGNIPVFSLDASLTSGDVSGKSFYVIEPNTTGITGYVYNDQNEDGQLTNGLDTPLAGVTVSLFYSDGTTPVKEIGGTNLQAVSGADGTYQFANLAPRVYVVKLAGIPAGFAVTGSKQGVGSSFDYIDLTLTTNANTQNNFFLALSGTNPNLGSVSGAVFGTNGSAVRASILETVDGNPHYVIANHTTVDRSIGFSNMIVTLEQSDGGSGWNQVSQLPTSSNGDYSFKGLTPGNYRIVLTPNPATTGNYQFANQTGGKLASRGGTPYQIPITVTAGGDLTEYNFWFTQPVTSTSFWAGLSHWADAHTGATAGVGAFWLSGMGTYTLYEEDGSPSPYPTVVGPTADGYKTEIPGIVPGIYKVGVAGLPSSLKAAEFWVRVTNTSYHIVQVAGNTNPSMTVSGADAQNSGIHGEIFIDGLGPLHTSFISVAYVGNSNPQLSGTSLGGSVATRTRSTAGDFSWRNLPKGQYRITKVELPAGYEDLIELDAIYDGIQWITSPTLPVTIDATAGSVHGVKIRYKNKNTGNYFHGQVWEDVNNDKAVYYSTINHSNNDFPVEGIVLELLDSTGTPTGATATTDTKGAYKFEGLGIGTYGVRIKDYNGYGLYQTQAEIYQTFTETTGVYEATHFLLAGSTNNDPTAGIGGAGAQNSGISGYAFIDLNGNNLPDLADEYKKYDGTPYIRLTKTMSDGTQWQSTRILNAAPTEYQFYNLGSGNYRVIISTFGAGAEYTVRWDSQSATPVNRIDVTIPTGTTTGFTDNNFQYAREEVAGISGNIYLDTWGSGQFDNGNMRTSLPGATLEWYDLLVSRTVPQGTTTVNADGTYVFNSANGNVIYSGSHWIVLKDVPSSHELVNDLDGATVPGDAGSPLGTILSGVVVSGSQNQDFLLKRSVQVELSGRIFVDGDYDGLYDAASPSPDDSVVAGAKVIIQDSGGNVVSTQNTDSSGVFKIYYLPNGTYTVILDTATLSSSLKIAGNAAGTTNDRFTVTIQDNQITGKKFWLNDKTDAGVAGQVVIDLDNDGIAKINADKTGDMSAGAGIRIYLHTAGTSDQFRTVTTNASGTFRFVPISAGTYDIEIDVSTLPSGYNLYGNSNSQIGTGAVRIQNVTLSGSMETGKYFLLAGDSNTSTNLGPNAVTNSGIKGKTTITAQGGAALSGVGISLVDLSSNKEVARTVSQADGSYQFLNLKTGNYKVAVFQTPSGYFTLGDVDTTTYPEAGELRSIVVANGVANQDIWFGENSAVGIQGTVSYVNAGDATQKALLAGMKVELYFSTDLSTPFKTATTDANGLYQFTDIPTLSYLVKIKDDELTNKGYTITTPASPGTYTVTNLALAGDTTKHFEVTGLRSFSGKIGKNESNGITFDTGIANIPTTLTWAGPDGILETADDVVFTSVTPTPTGQFAITAGKTDINGAYTYSNLPIGNYQMTYTESAVTSQGLALIPVADLAGNTAPPRTAAISTGNI